MTNVRLIWTVFGKGRHSLSDDFATITDRSMGQTGSYSVPLDSGRPESMWLGPATLQWSV